MLALGDEILGRLGVAVIGHDHDPPLGLVVLAELHPAGDIGDDRVVLRLPRLEQLGHPRQAAGDVAGLGRFPRDAGEHVAGMHRLAVLDVEDGVDREEVLRLAPVGQRDDLAALVSESHARLEIAAARLLAPVDHHLVGDPGPLVHHLAEGEALHHVGEAHRARALGNQRQRERIPRRDGVPALDGLALGHVELGTVRDAGGAHAPCPCRRAARPRDCGPSPPGCRCCRSPRSRFRSPPSRRSAPRRSTAPPRAGPRRRCGRCAW